MINLKGLKTRKAVKNFKKGVADAAKGISKNLAGGGVMGAVKQIKQKKQEKKAFSKLATSIGKSSAGMLKEGLTEAYKNKKKK